ncbi:site-specific integrase [Salinibacter ruber]|uniref:site-specific integrase n=1 Tax=Salinibacter ruber TaxID=146919 RepID=UPI002169C5DB|nr:site-specific integrase [Salinibacter ruber]MCS4185215.1 integrase [Salinibacter ruber]
MSDSVRPDSIDTAPETAGARQSAADSLPAEQEAVPTGPLVDTGALPAGVTPEDVADLSDLWKRHGMADATRKAYGVQWRGFVQWCEGYGATALPADPAAVAKYLKQRADGGASVSTVNQARCAIGKAHEHAGEDDPTKRRAVTKTVKALRRRDGTRPEKKRAATLEEVRQMVEATPPAPGTPAPEPGADRAKYAAHLRGIRNRAALLIGFATACRRSEIAGMELGHVSEVDGGLEVLIPESKSDQTGEGKLKGVPFGSDPDTCPVRALRRWTGAAAIEEGPIFRPVRNDGAVPARAVTGQTIRNVVTAAADRAGLDDPKSYAGHSLRSGWITEAARRGAPLALAQKHAGHADSAQTAEYFQRVNLIDDTPDVGL